MYTHVEKTGNVLCIGKFEIGFLFLFFFAAKREFEIGFIQANYTRVHYILYS